MIDNADNATNNLNFLTGVTAHYLITNNAAGDTSICLESTNGVLSTSLLYVSTATSNFVVAVSGFTSKSNVTVGAMGAAAVPGAEVEVLGPATVVNVGAKTNNIIGRQRGVVCGPLGPGRPGDAHHGTRRRAP